MKVGDTSPPIAVEVTSDGSPVDLSDATVTFRVRKPSGTVVNWTGDVTDGPAGQVEYELETGDLDEAGIWYFELEIDWGGGSIETSPADGVSTFVVHGAIT
jgi:hypothetical protein